MPVPKSVVTRTRAEPRFHLCAAEGFERAHERPAIQCAARASPGEVRSARISHNAISQNGIHRKCRVAAKETWQFYDNYAYTCQRYYAAET
jgi:hypothetical protein